MSISPAAIPAVRIWLLRTSTICDVRPYLPKKSKSWAIHSGATRGVGLGNPITIRVGVAAARVTRAGNKTVQVINATTKHNRNDKRQFAKVEKRAIKDTPSWLANRTTRNYSTACQSCKGK